MEGMIELLYIVKSFVNVTIYSQYYNNRKNLNKTEEK
jgi:hypothetical protein